MSADASAVNNRRPSRKDYKRAVRKDTDKADDKGKSAPNEVRVTASRGQRFYISYIIDLFNGENDKPKSDSVILSGMGDAIYNAVNIAEVVKRRIKGLHQTCDIGSQTMSDEYEPLKEGAEKLVVQRKVSTMTIVLSTKQLDTKHIGYQAPLPESEVTEGKPEPKPRSPRKEGEEPRRRGGRGRKGGDKKDAPKKEGGEKKGEKKEEKKGGRGEKKADAAPARGGRGRDERSGGRGGRGSAPRGGRGGAAADAAPARGGRGAPRGGARGGARGGDRAARGAPRGGYEGGRREGGRGEGRGGARK